MVGVRIDKALGLLPEIGSRSRAENLINKGLVTVGGKPVKSSHRIEAGDLIHVEIPEAQPVDLQPLPLKLDVIYEDQDLLVVNKPSGLVVHPAAGHAQDTLANALLHHTNDLSMKFGENRPGIVHRLDRDTSGLLVVAKNDFTHEKLAQQFKNKTTHRIYYAACLGLAKASEGTVQSFLVRHPTQRKKFASLVGADRKIIRRQNDPSATGKWAITHYQVVKKTPAGLSYLRLRLETGRTHQIRVHLSEMGLPILGDEIYGSGKKKNLLADFPRLALHAAELGFNHPRSGKNLSFVQDWPESVGRLLMEMGLL